MKILEFSTRGLSRETAADAREAVREHAQRLSEHFADLMACRVAVERKQRRHPRSGNDYRVRVSVTLPPSRELVASHGLGDSERGDSLMHVIRSTFHSVERQIKDARSVRRGDVKSHPMELGFVVRLFSERGYGFLRSASLGHEVFFHRNAVLSDDFDRLAVGTQVRYVEEAGEEGPQASTLQIVDKPGEREHERGEESASEPPEPWKP